jgi:hypothetical protein
MQQPARSKLLHNQYCKPSAQSDVHVIVAQAAVQATQVSAWPRSSDVTPQQASSFGVGRYWSTLLKHTGSAMHKELTHKWPY